MKTVAGKQYSEKTQFLSRVRDEITKCGIVNVLPKCVKAYPASIGMLYMMTSTNKPAVAELHAKGIFSETHQLLF